MKKEIIYILVPIIMCVGGVVFKSILLSDTLADTQQILDTGNDISAKYYKDSLVQNNIANIKNLYEMNKRDKREYGDVIADILKTVETLLMKSGIEYKGDDINQDLDEVKDYKTGTTSFYIILDITSDFKKIKNLIQLIEQNDLVINLKTVELIRAKVSKEEKEQGGANLKESEIDEFNAFVPVNMKATLEFIKFL